MTNMPLWNSTLYDNAHAFVWQYGKALLELLAPQPGEQILDLGCGTGHLTAEIAQAGAAVLGLDADRSMLQQAQQHYPHLRFELADARSFDVTDAVDAVFSNATLHWIKDADAVITRVRCALKLGGRFVAEFGGKGNIGAIAAATTQALKELGYSNAADLNPWYFPSLGEYTQRLEQQGFEVRYGVLFDRPTALEGGRVGLENWLRMFAHRILAHLPDEEQILVIRRVETLLEPTLYRDGTWWADYRRLRIVAIAPH